MYIPHHYLETDKKEIVGFMQAYNFATIITTENNTPTATHLPFVVTESGDEIILLSHFAKANPQWRAITDSNILVIFSEPHAYISPKHYDSEINVPTWNYIAVHAYGKGTLITGQEAAFALLETTINTFEEGYKSQWDALPNDYKLKMLNGIVAFQIVVTDLQAKKKLSQNKNNTEKQRIISAFENSTNPNENAIAAFMVKEEIIKDGQ